MKIVKKLISIVLSLLMFISAFTIVSFSVGSVSIDTVSSGAIGGQTGDCNWQYISALGKLIISGSGAMGYIEDSVSQPWADYSENIKFIQIDEGVTEISDYAFYELNISEVSIPNTVETIGNEAFYCTQLKKITIPDSVTVIKEKAFSSCHNLESVTIGSGVELIGKDAFNWDEFAPEDYEINYPYFDRVNITDLSKWCSIKFENEGSNPLCFGMNIYNDNKLVTDLQIPSGVKTISNYAFVNSSIYSVSLFDSVETIGVSSFEGCSELKELKISKSLKRVNENAFFNNSSLSNVYYEGTQEDWYAVDFYNGNNNLLSAKISYEYNPNAQQTEPSTGDKLINGYYPVGSTELFGLFWQPNHKYIMNYYAGYYYVDISNVSSGNYECKTIYYNNGEYEWHPGGMGNSLQINVNDDNSTVRIVLKPSSVDEYNVLYEEIYGPWESVPAFTLPAEPTNPTEPSTKATDPLTTPVQPTTQAAESTEPVAITESGIYLNNKKYNCSVGDTIIYRVDLQSDSLISCGQFSLEYPSDIIEFEIENIPNLSNCVLNHRQKNTLAFNFLTLNSPLDFTENKLLLEFRFKVIKSGAGTIRLNKEILSCVDSTGDILDIIDYSHFNESLIVNSVSTTVKLNKSSGIVYRKGQLQIKSTVTNGKGKTTYKSSNIKVAKVNSSGKVTGEKKGTAIITVTNNGVSEKFKVTVKNPKLNLTKKTITAGKSFNIRITGQVGTPKFSSSNKKVTTVTSSGKVKGIKKGTATIKVKTNGLTLKCKITVQPNYQKYKGTWKNGKNKIVIKSVKGSKIKAYLFTQFITYERVAYANVSGTIKDNSVKLYFKNDGWFNKGYCILEFKKNSINAKTKITYRNPSANANLYINGTFKKK